jgi:hypothetical protein
MLLEARLIVKSNPKSRRLRIQESWTATEKESRKFLAVVKQVSLIALLESNLVRQK